MIRRERITPRLDADFVFAIGLRIDQPWKIHRWLPAVRALPRMARELYRQPDLGFVHAELLFSNEIVMVQYWRSMDQLLAYALNRDARHLPVWRRFNQVVGIDPSLAAWHETFVAASGDPQKVFANIPPFGPGPGQVAALEAVNGGRESAAGHFGAHGDAV